MAKFYADPTVEVKVILELSEAELRALDALVGYDFDEFLSVFKEKLGKHYMEGHEKGLKSFFISTRQLVPSILSKANKARNVFNG